MVIWGTKIISVQVVPMVTFVTIFSSITKITCVSIISMVIFFTMVNLVTKDTSDPVVAMVTRVARCSEL